MNVNPMSNLKPSNTIDQNASFLATLSHAMANSPGVNGHIPYGQYNKKNTQHELPFMESFSTDKTQYRNSAKKPPSTAQRSNRHKISHFIQYQSLKESQ